MKTKLNQSKLKLAIVSAMLIGTAALSVSAYSDTASMDVSANIGMACTITATDIAFGAYDPIVTNADTDLTANGSVTSTCTVGSSGSIKISQGVNPGVDSTDAVPVRNMALAGEGPASTLGYDVFSDDALTLSWENATGVGYNASGVAEEMIVYGKVAAGQTDAMQGSYSDTLTVTVNY